ncbi:MAG: DUF3793 family protein [Clostridia bacterium]|nr:DUF3793 family protein [Clostridia bacterium]
MLPQLISWRESLKKLSGGDKFFERWLFIASSKVLFAGKPAELLIIKEDSLFEMDLDTLLDRARRLIPQWGLSVSVIKRNHLGARIIFYRRQRVNKILKQVQTMPFFLELGYPQNMLAEDFFNEIRDRWTFSGEMPHEIGIALGYPVKDVVGFLEAAPLEYQGNYGWRVYGDPEPSLKLIEDYNLGKQRAYDFLEIEPENLFRGE